MKKILTFLVLFQSVIIYSQTAIGTWRDHFAFNSISYTCELKDGRLVGVAKNGLLYINNDGSIEKLTKANGLSDVNISCMKYFENINSIVLTYTNGNIDIIKNDLIINISDIKRKNMSGDKNIYSITQDGNCALLSVGFGIVKLDVENAEIIDTYYIGSQASFVVVNDIAISEDSIFAATNEGLFCANRNDFLSDFNNWKISNNSQYIRYLKISYIDNKLFLVVEKTNNAFEFVRRNSNYTWTNLWGVNENAKILFYDNIYLVTTYNIKIFSNEGTYLGIIENYSTTNTMYPQYINITKNGDYIIGDKNLGLAKINDNDIDFYYLNGVYADEVLRVNAEKNTVIATRGGIKNTWKAGTFSILSSNQWTNYLNNNYKDFYTILQDKNDTKHFYIGSWGYGLFEYQDTNLINHYDETNSPLQTIYANAPYIRISGIAYDKNNNIWVINRAIDNPLNVLKPDKTWVSYNLPSIKDDNTEDLIIDQNDNIWAIIPDKGLFAFDYNQTLENKGDDINKVFYPYDENNERIGNKVTTLALDKDGAIWFGTDQGVGVMYNPNNFNDLDFRASKIKITAYLNDSLVTNYLLAEEEITAIAIDGGNRKWFGTSNSGVYLMNSTGTVELQHFDVKNSALPSNKIFSIAIEPESGEVFFATSVGLVSYKSDATEAKSLFENVYAYPNPVRPEYNGIITIKGLMEKTNVKITDIAGNLVYETTSNGGLATWDGNNFNGQRVATGVYLVLCSNNDGTESFITKILFIN